MPITLRLNTVRGRLLGTAETPGTVTGWRGALFSAIALVPAAMASQHTD
jgi:hypothetical protein